MAEQYAVIVESRLNSSLDKRVVIALVADIVGACHKVDLASPELVIMVQILKVTSSPRRYYDNVCAGGLWSQYSAELHPVQKVQHSRILQSQPAWIRVTPHFNKIISNHLLC